MTRQWRITQAAVFVLAAAFCVFGLASLVLIGPCVRNVGITVGAVAAMVLAGKEMS